MPVRRLRLDGEGKSCRSGSLEHVSVSSTLSTQARQGKSTEGFKNAGKSGNGCSRSPKNQIIPDLRGVTQ